MDEGYILSNKFRRVIFDSLMNDETNIKNISKKHRIIESITQRIIDDFVEKGIVEKKNSRYHLTEEGEKLAATIKA